MIINHELLELNEPSARRKPIYNFNFIEISLIKKMPAFLFVKYV